MYEQCFAAKEYNLYGSSHLGVKKDTSLLVNTRFKASSIDESGNFVKDVVYFNHLQQLDTIKTKRILAFKQFELSNHLGNVLATILDRRTLHDTTIYNSGNDTAALWDADIVSAQDYYPFGMLLPDRVYSADSTGSGGSRYGFNGMERDDEWNGAGNAYDFGARMYDARIGRWYSTDAFEGKHPDLAPYHYAGSNPILFIDSDGNEFRIYDFSFSEQSWNDFVTIFDTRYDGLVSVQKEYKEYKVKRAVPNSSSGETYIQNNSYYIISIGINEKKLTQVATKRAQEKADAENTDLTADMINNEKNKIRNEIESSYAYSTLHEMMKPGTPNEKFQFTNSSWGCFAGKDCNGYQGLGVGNIAKASQDVAFSLLFHEIMEGSAYVHAEQNGTDDSYSRCHGIALDAQATDLGVTAVYSRMEALEGVNPNPDTKNSFNYMVVFQAVTTNGNITSYKKIEYKFKMVEGELTKLENGMYYNKTESNLSPEEYEEETESLDTH